MIGRHKEGGKQNVKNDDPLSLLFMLVLLFFAKVRLSKIAFSLDRVDVFDVSPIAFFSLLFLFFVAFWDLHKCLQIIILDFLPGPKWY